MIRTALLAVLLAASAAMAEQIPSETALRAAATQAAALPDSDALLAACPADIYASRRNPLRDLFQDKQLHGWTYCRDNADACAKACRTDMDGGACLALATAMEIADRPEFELPARRYHAFACALGQAGGCTNRGGGMRNAPVPGDPWWPEAAIAPAEVAKENCLYHSFRTACTDGDSWGCAMLGQTLEFGEGTAPDAASAQLHYTQACALAGDEAFAACVFARKGLDRLAQPSVNP